MLFNGVEVNEGDKVKVSFTDTVGSIYAGYGGKSAEIELMSEGIVFNSDDVIKTYPDLSIEVVQRAFPMVASSIISKAAGRYGNETRYVLDENEKWIDLSTNVAYTVDDLGSREDYEVIYLAEEY